MWGVTYAAQGGLMSRKNSRPEHLDHILKNWPYEPQGISVRMIRGGDQRDVIQMRVDMGVLQLETIGRPDGTRPHDCPTYHDYLLVAAQEGGDEFEMSEEQCGEADREFVQFYHRRVCWLALREFDRAVADADHTLALMDFCRDYSPDEQWTISHEQYRPFVLFHRTQAAALSRLERDGPEAAVEEINDGLLTLKELFERYDATEQYEDDELVQRLIETRESLREQHDVGRTLSERLNDAVAAEQYELAAKLRDELARRKSGGAR